MKGASANCLVNLTVNLFRPGGSCHCPEARDATLNKRKRGKYKINSTLEAFVITVPSLLHTEPHILVTKHRGDDQLFSVSEEKFVKGHPNMRKITLFSLSFK